MPPKDRHQNVPIFLKHILYCYIYKINLGNSALGYVLNFFNTIYQRSPDLVSPQCARPNFGLSAQCVGRRYVYYQKHFGVLLPLSYLCYFLTECYETLHSLQVCSEILSYIKHTKFYSSNLSGTKIVVQDHSF